MSHSTDLTLDLGTDEEKSISWDLFAYNSIPCATVEYSVECTGPDTHKYQINSDGSEEFFGNTDSQCRYFNYEDA